VLGGTLLLGAFPVVYANVLPAFYIPILTMLFALVFRGIAFEFRFRSTRARMWWDVAFSTGSILAAFMQGLMLGVYIEGMPVADGHLARTLTMVSGFDVLCGLGVMAGYALLGATWLILKATGETQAFARRAASGALSLTLSFAALISAWMPLRHPFIAQRWFSLPNVFYLWIVPVATGLLAIAIWRTIRHGRDAMPFVLSVALVLLIYLGIAISLWPYAIPYSVTIWQAAGSHATLVFLGVGTAITLPIILGYSGYTYWVFRGKLAREARYGG